MAFDDNEYSSSPGSDDVWDQSFELCEGCPDCDAFARHMILDMEVELRTLSLDLWIAGWTPNELIAEVRQATGSKASVSLVSQLLIVDDSHRSDQARPDAWRGEIASLRAMTGVADVEIGWLSRWIRGFDDAERATRCLQATADSLGDLVDPRVSA